MVDAGGPRVPTPAPAPDLVATRLRLALEAAQLGLWDWDLATGGLVWDERSAAMYGTTLAESTGSIADVAARVHPDDLEAVWDALQDAIDRAGAVDVEFRVIWPDDSVHWLYGRGQALIDATGAVTRVLGINADVTGQVRERERARQAEQQAAQASRRLAETLQRSLLTDPPQPPGLEIAVRYRAAASDAQVGGDWYDAFATGDGGTTLVIGDVAGHDRNAAAAMGQVRNLLRGVAQALGEPPAALLAALDRALTALELPILSTAVLAQLRRDDDGDGWRLVWSNAGHPPPLLLHPNGQAQLLTREADLLLGLDPATGRADHELELPTGATVVLYTDGLIERRGESLDDGLEHLRRTGGQLAGLPAERLADALLDQLAGNADDDIALLTLRLPEQTGHAGS